jgi:hypothetical protein
MLTIRFDNKPEMVRRGIAVINLAITDRRLTNFSAIGCIRGEVRRHDLRDMSVEAARTDVSYEPSDPVEALKCLDAVEENLREDMRSYESQSTAVDLIENTLPSHFGVPKAALDPALHGFRFTISGEDLLAPGAFDEFFCLSVVLALQKPSCVLSVGVSGIQTRLSMRPVSIVKKMFEESIELAFLYD